MQYPMSLVINAGGESRRMGQPKALLPVPSDNRPLLAHIIDRFASLALQPTIVIANDSRIRAEAELGDNIQWLADRLPGVGPLGGIVTALAAVEAWAIIVACDMPLLDPALFAYLMQLSDEQDEDGQAKWDAIVPIVDDIPQPLHALYHRRCLPVVESRLAAGERRATAFLPDVRTCHVDEQTLRQFDPHLHSFVNVNTREDWVQALSLLPKM